MGVKISHDEFIARSRKLHMLTYDYSKTVYKKSSSRVTIICPIHGEFRQSPASHMRGHGCKKCATTSTNNKRRLTTARFISDAIAVHGDKYNYSRVKYERYNGDVEIICPKHGIFFQSYNTHVRKGCECRECHLEKRFNKKRRFNVMTYDKKCLGLANGGVVHEKDPIFVNQNGRKILGYFQSFNVHTRKVEYTCSGSAFEYYMTDIENVTEAGQITVEPDYMKNALIKKLDDLEPEELAVLAGRLFGGECEYTGDQYTFNVEPVRFVGCKGEQYLGEYE